MSTNQTTASWFQQRDESDKYFRWFQTYLLMGSNRSLHGAYNLFHMQSRYKSAKVRKPSPSWVQTSRDWQWQSRAADWDAAQHRLQVEADRQQRMELLNRLNGSMEQLLDKVEQMLAMPIYEVNVSEDGCTTTIKPTRWSFDTVARLMLVFMKLNEMAKEQCHLYQGQSTVSPTPSPQPSQHDPATDLDDETLALIAYGGGVDLYKETI